MSYVELLAERVAAGHPTAVAKVVSVPEGATAIMGQALVVGPQGLLVSQVEDTTLQAAMADLAVQMLAEGRSGVERVVTPQGPVRVYVESFLPDPVLVVIGAGHVGQMVAQVGALAGFEVVVLDDRSQYANAERFPTASRVICGPFANELAKLGLGPRHYVVLMTRGHHQDRQCLEELLPAPVAYLGMIGSRTRIETIFEILRSAGFDQELLDRVRAPIGLDIGARTPAEIAVAVIAEIIAARRGGTGAPLSQIGRSLVHTNRR